MRIAISMWSYASRLQGGREDIEAFLDAAEGLGVDAVELLSYFWDDYQHELRAIITSLKERGLPVCVYALGNNFAVASDREWRQQVDETKRGIDVACALGAPIVRVFAGDVGALTFEDAFPRIVEGLRASAGYAQERGVLLALENHGRLAGRADQILAILQAVGIPALGSNPDTGNFMLAGEDPCHAIERLKGRIFSVHLKDLLEVPKDAKADHEGLDGRGYRFTVIGEGQVNLDRVLSSLQTTGFDGYLSVEYEGKEDPTTGCQRSVANARAALQRLTK